MVSRPRWSRDLNTGALKLQEWTVTVEVARVDFAVVDSEGGKAQKVDNDGFHRVELSSRFTVL